MGSTTYSEELRLKFGDVTVSVEPAEDIRFGISDEQGYFLCDGEPDLRLRLRSYRDDSVNLKSEDKVFDSGGIWDLYRSGGKYIFNCYFDDFGRTPFRTAVINDSFTAGDIYLRNGSNGSDPAYPLVYPLDELLMVHILSTGKGIMMHGCGLMINGAGYLFVGPSGRGKSTISRVLKEASGAVILNDDRIVVRSDGVAGRYRIYGTPWHGDVSDCSSDSAILKRIFFIRHAEMNSSASMGEVEAAARLVSCSFSPLWDGRGMANILDFASTLAHHVPSFDLGFRPDKSIARFLKLI